MTPESFDTPSATTGRLASATGPRSHRPGPGRHHLHVGLDRGSQGRDADAPEHGVCRALGQHVSGAARRRRDRLCALPLAFDYGLYQVLMSVKVGATLVLETSFAFPVKVLERDGAARRSPSSRACRRSSRCCWTSRTLASYRPACTAHDHQHGGGAVRRAHPPTARPLPAGAAVLDVRPHRMQARHLPAARAARHPPDQRRARHAERGGLAGRRSRPAPAQRQHRRAGDPRQQRDARLLGEARGDGQAPQTRAHCPARWCSTRATSSAPTTRAGSTSSRARTTSSRAAARRSARARWRTCSTRSPGVLRGGGHRRARRRARPGDQGVRRARARASRSPSAT